jgi:hypothetical protein
LLALFLGVFLASYCEATFYVSDCSAQNVQYVHDNLAQDGDTITLPAGTFSWTTHVDITKAITIQGQTTLNSDTGICNDQTVLVDNIVQAPGGTGFFHCTASPNKPLRITGITLTGVGGRQETAYNGAIRLGGAGDQVRIDHIHNTGGLRQSIFIALWGNIYGVADHIVEDNLAGQNSQSQVQNGIEANGDVEFSQPAGYGGDRFFFFEDWYINNWGHLFSTGGGFDGGHGAKFVLRHCHFYDVKILCHGTEGARNRGGRAQEIYNNDYHWSYFTTMDGIRSGTLIAHDNTYDGIAPRGYGLQTCRMFHTGDGTWGGATGRNAWDSNDPTMYASGTATAVNTIPGNTVTITDSTKNWTVNQWVGYSVSNAAGTVLYVQSNTSNSVTGPEAGYGGPYFSVGDTYQIRKVLAAIDQPCRGAGDLISGDSPPPAWPHQAIEPCYSWNNVFTPTGAHINWSPEMNAPLLEGRDYFSNTAMPGYTPYTYPHPLVTGQPQPTPTPSATSTPTPTPTPIPSPTPTVSSTSTPAPTATPGHSRGHHPHP